MGTSQFKPEGDLPTNVQTFDRIFKFPDSSRRLLLVDSTLPVRLIGVARRRGGLLLTNPPPLGGDFIPALPNSLPPRQVNPRLQYARKVW